MSSTPPRSVLVVIVCGMVMSAPIVTNGQVIHPPVTGAAEAYERIQREAATFAPGDPIEISTYDGRLLIGAFEIVTSDFVLLWVPHRHGSQPERVPILLIRTISPARPHPGIAVRQAIKRAFWQTVVGYAVTIAGMAIVAATSH